MTQQNHDGHNNTVIRFAAIPSIIALLSAAFIGWAISLLASTPDMKLTAALAAGITAAMFLLCHANVGGSRSATVIKATAWFGLIVTEIILSCLALWCHSTDIFILVTGAAMLIFISTAYGVARSGQ